MVKQNGLIRRYLRSVSGLLPQHMPHATTARTHARTTHDGRTDELRILHFFTPSLSTPSDRSGRYRYQVLYRGTVVDVRLDLEYKPRTVLLPVPRTLRSSARTVYPIDRYSTTSRTTVQYCMTVDEVGSSRTVVSSLVLVLVPVPSVMSHDVMIERRQSDNQVGEQTRKDLSLCTLHVV